MMRMMSNKKNVKITSLVIAVLFVLSVAGIAMMQMGNPANAAPSTTIGVVDMSKVFTADSPDIVNSQKAMQDASKATQDSFNEKSAKMSDEEKSKLFADMQKDLSAKQEEIQNGLKDKVDASVKSVAEAKGLTLVVDKRVVLYGGSDITDEVGKKLNQDQSKK
jgi:outer membrane protein